MGLAGRKEKQRIPADPRNLSWADDASRFGLSYLSKFGWDASQGLGTSGGGMRTHIKVQQKLDMMGIGAQHQRDPNGIAWKQSKEFEVLLKRLNESAEQGKGADGEDGEGEGVRVRETAMSTAFICAQEENASEKLGDESSVATTKRKHKDGHDPDAGENSKKKRKKEKEKRQKSSSDSDSTVPAIDHTSESSSGLSKPPSEPIPRSRPMAHRARIRAAKRISGKSASAIAEILGIAPSPSMSTESTPTPASTTPSSSTPTPQLSLSLDNLTTSTKSVADYFKEKLLARSSSSPAASSAPSGSTTPGLCPTWLGLGLTRLDDDDELPRRGIGSGASAVSPPSRVPEAESPSGGGDGNTDGDSRDMMMEKQRQKAERKAEKRKKRETEANQVILEDVSVIKKKEDDDAESGPRSSKERKCHERKQPVPANQTDDNDSEAAEKKHERSTPSGPFPDPNKKHKKKRS